jgi:hypothetical protein
VSELILGALSLLLGYMIIRFIMALLRKRAHPSDHAIAWSVMGIVFSAALLLLVGFAYGANATDWWAMCKPQPQCRAWQAAERSTVLRKCWSIDGKRFIRVPHLCPPEWDSRAWPHKGQLYTCRWNGCGWSYIDPLPGDDPFEL